ncbi:hypothetical protein [Priestia megaterium]|uniref:hypothetical protein n=1 Tax=Priestia megaterium TaxID=1404 RepID=UPI000BFD76AB|nr:hypothetical protein [Priestia megaterium]PGY51515.1 hypothetical protein COE35_13575 [Priestia megaterium]
MSLEFLKSYLKSNEVTERNKTLHFQQTVMDSYSLLDDSHAPVIKKLAENFPDDSLFEKAWESIIEDRTKKIFKHNPHLEAYRANLDFMVIMANKELTQNYGAGGKSLIVLDHHTISYLWDMNKVFVYGMSFGYKECLRLTKGITHFHAAIISKSGGGKLKIPTVPTLPKHPGLALMSVLAIITEIQEVFLLCHEIAHFIIDNKYFDSEKYHKQTLEEYEIFSGMLFHYLSLEELEGEEKETTLTELLADEIAMDLLFNIYGHSSETVELFCYSVYLLFRYQLTLKIVGRDENKNVLENKTWILRNDSIRRKFTEFEASYGTFGDSVDTFANDIVSETAYSLANIFTEPKSSTNKKKNKSKVRRRASKQARKNNRK